jgi:hypothetical protein
MISAPVRVVLVVAVVLSGCGPSPTEYCSSLAQKMSELQHDCSGGPTDVIKSVIEKGCTTQLDGQTKHNRGVYDATKAAACLKELETATCLKLSDSNSTTVQACNAVVKGTVAIGGACIFEQDCANGAACVKSDSASCGGTCAAKKAPGEACQNASDCDPGGTSKVAVCGLSPQVCAQNPAPTRSEAAVGADCGGSETEIKICARGSTCSANGSAITCKAFVREGAACTVGNNECEFFTSCKAGICTRFNSVGGSCSANSTATEEASLCLQGSCVGGTCVAPKAEGESCTSFTDCASFSCSVGKCAAACDETHP